MAKELKEAKGGAEALQVLGKWARISGNQDVLTGTALFEGFKDGMAGAGLNALDSAVGVMRDPMASIDAMKEFAASADGKKLLGAAYGAFQSQLNQVGQALQEGGEANGENLGKQMGQALALFAQVIATSGTGAAQGASTLSKAGIEVSSNGFKEIVASTRAAGGIEGALAKLERNGPDPDVPVLDTPKPVVTPPKVSDAGPGIGQTGTGTVWDSIKTTSPVHPGSVVPLSFEFSLGSGEKIWVDGNATKHIAEYAAYKAVNFTPEAVRLASQVQLGSLKVAVETASKAGLQYREIINVDGWELMFAPPKTAEQFSVLYHAVFKLR